MNIRIKFVLFIISGLILLLAGVVQAINRDYLAIFPLVSSLYLIMTSFRLKS